MSHAYSQQEGNEYMSHASSSHAYTEDEKNEYKKDPIAFCKKKFGDSFIRVDWQTVNGVDQKHLKHVCTFSNGDYGFVSLNEGVVSTDSEQYDPVNRPLHYNQHPSGVECITITEHFNFNIGSAVKYLWRSGLKGDRIQDLEKALWYIDREIIRLKTNKDRQEKA